MTSDQIDCATRESAHEDNDGGDFTSAVLAAIDSAAREHPSVEWLSVEQVMNDLIRAQLPPDQTPEWTGIAVSLSVFLSRNPHHDPTVPIVHGSVQVPQLDPTERVLANRAIRLHWNAMQLVGTGHSWLETANAALSDITTSLPAKAEPMVRQMFTSLDQIVAKYGNVDDRLAHTHYARAAIVAIGHLVTGTLDIDDVVQRLADRIEQETNDLQEFIDTRAWIVRGDAPANAPLSTIRFWRPSEPQPSSPCALGRRIPTTPPYLLPRCETQSRRSRNFIALCGWVSTVIWRAPSALSLV